MPRFVLPLVVLLALCAPVVAEEPFAFDRTPGRLPKSVVPHRYSIHLEPSIEEAKFTGRETIALEVRQPVRQIVMNIAGLTVTEAHLRRAGQAEVPVRIEAMEDEQLLTLTLGEELPPGDCELELHWSGALSETPMGLSITRFDTDAGERRALTTQMEATDARRMFPCWDEPVFRAVYELSAVVPATHLAISNMPVVSEQPTSAGLKEVRFAPTPAMASYLVAFAEGEFETLEDDVAGVHLRIITTPGKREQGRYALEATKKILPYYNEYFGTPYPLPKLDQFCFPGFSQGGMENWGAIFYNDTTLLADPRGASQSNRERVFGVVAHEIAHQWFGDLVTMAWWDNLWLNEGFASWMGTKASEHFNPDWAIGPRAAADKEGAMHRDARSTTHPIQQKVQNESQAADAFDEITYSKGQSFLRMLESWLGEEAFRAGIRQYLAAHAMSSSTTADLWSALELASGKPVRRLAAHWTEQPGFPVILANEGAALTLRQEHFTIHQQAPAPLTWETPVTYAPLDDLVHPRLQVVEADPVILEAAKTSSNPLLLNLGGIGYFRTLYDSKTFGRIADRVALLPETDRFCLLADAWAMVQAGRAPMTGFLELLETLAPAERSLVVWPQILRILNSVDELLVGDPNRENYRRWAGTLLHPEFERLTWDPVAGETGPAKTLRSDVIMALGRWRSGPDSAAIVREAQRRFESFAKDPESLAPDLRGAVFTLVGIHADAAAYERLRTLGKAAASTELKRQLYRGLSACPVPELASKTLELTLTGELPPTDAAYLVTRVADRGELPELAWVFARQHYSALTAKLPSIRANSWLPELAHSFHKEAWAAEVETFAKAHLPAASAPSVAQATDEIRFKAEFKARILPALQSWITSHPGLRSLE